MIDCVMGKGLREGEMREPGELRTIQVLGAMEGFKIPCSRFLRKLYL